MGEDPFVRWITRIGARAGRPHPYHPPVERVFTRIAPAVPHRVTPIMNMNTGRMRRQWWTTAAANLVMGVPCVVPVWLLWYVAVNGPLAELGWTVREPTENDGMLLWLVIAVSVVTAFVLLWWLANDFLRRWNTAAARVYWPVCALVTLVPTLTLISLS